MSFGGFGRGALLCTFFIYVQTSSAQISINEIVADNKDLDGSGSDWVELYNSGAAAVNLAGYSLTDSVATPRKWVFPSVTIGAKGFVQVLLNSSEPPSITPGSPLNAGFGLKASGDRIELYSPSTILIDSVRFGPQAANFSLGRVPDGFRLFTLCTPTPAGANTAKTLGQQSVLRINEWMASPSSGEDWFEIYNPGTLPVQLSGLYFIDDGNAPSPVAPYSFVGIDRYAYVQFYADNSTNDNEVTFKLGGSGDSISLFTSAGSQIHSVRFGQQTADISEGSLPDGSDTRRPLNTPTPGESNLIRYSGLVVNELLSHTDPPVEDAVEFFNQSDLPIDISGWFLSNSRNELKKFQAPNNTIVAPQGYLVIYENQFNRPGDAKGFTFNSSQGDQIYLSEAKNGELTGAIVSETFEAAENGVSFGRYETSIPGDYKFVAMEKRTFGGPDNPTSLESFRSGKGALNSPPKVGPIVINEIMYHPLANAADSSDNTLDEYIELKNISAQTAFLFDPQNPVNRWRLQGASEFTFPAGVSLPAAAYALVVSFDPGDAAQLGAFRTKFSVPAGVQIFGPYSGKLNNAGDAVELYKPDPPQLPPHPDAGFVPYIRVDKVNYLDVAPWPTDADGTGKSLQRKNSTAFGNDPINWQASAPSAGKGSSTEVLDADGDGMPDVWEQQFGLNPANPDDASADADGDRLTNLQEFLSGTDPRSAASHLKLLGLSPDSVNGAVLSFSSVAGKSYSVQYRNNLLPSSTWQTLISTNATGSDVTVRDTDAAGRQTRFYRVVTPAAE